MPPFPYLGSFRSSPLKALDYESISQVAQDLWKQKVKGVALGDFITAFAKELNNVLKKNRESTIDFYVLFNSISPLIEKKLRHRDYEQSYSLCDALIKKLPENSVTNIPDASLKMIQCAVYSVSLIDTNPDMWAGTLASALEKQSITKITLECLSQCIKAQYPRLEKDGAEQLALEIKGILEQKHSSLKIELSTNKNRP